MRQKAYCHYCGTRLRKKVWEGRTRRFCDRCNEPIYENPIPATCLVVIDKRERVLLVKRSVDPQKGLWCLPGGFVELGETPDQAALRELREETGLSGQVDSLLGVAANHSTRYDTVLMIGYLVRNYSGTPQAGDDASEVRSFHPEDLPEIAFQSHMAFIQKYFSTRSG